jgi:hypothetical protein
MVERRPPQAPPGSDTAADQREDTVAIPVNRPAPSNGAPSGNGKVLPPMPKDAPTGRSATPPPPPARKPTSKPTAKPTERPAAKPRSKPVPTGAQQAAPTQPPAPARKARPAATSTQPTPAPTPAAGTPVAKQRPAVSPMPVAPQVDKRAQRQAERDAKARERAAAKQAAREQKDSKSAAKTQVAETKAAPKPSRRARLRMTRIDPWSVMKTAFLLSIALGIVVVVSVFMVWSVLDAADVWSSINQTVRDVLGGESATSFDIEDYLGTRRVVGFAMIVAAVDVVLLTAIATLGAFLYNMSASLLGGIEVTLAEDK